VQNHIVVKAACGSNTLVIEEAAVLAYAFLGADMPVGDLAQYFEE
tara:strand:- start:572 stop:706 length:135 start_codon:yes stop_codon:yes gene_type:complete